MSYKIPASKSDKKDSRGKEGPLRKLVDGFLLPLLERPHVTHNSQICFGKANRPNKKVSDAESMAVIDGRSDLLRFVVALRQFSSDSVKRASPGRRDATCVKDFLRTEKCGQAVYRLPNLLRDLPVSCGILLCMY